jgi:anaerobic C4-dicarboxylate transporter DcuA
MTLSIVLQFDAAQADAHPWTFAVGLFFASMLPCRPGATNRALMPLGITPGIPPPARIAMFPAINFDLPGTTKIGKYVLNHFFMIPGIIATAVTVVTGLFLAKSMSRMEEVSDVTKASAQ